MHEAEDDAKSRSSSCISISSSSTCEQHVCENLPSELSLCPSRIIPEESMYIDVSNVVGPDRSLSYPSPVLPTGHLDNSADVYLDFSESEAKSVEDNYVVLSPDCGKISDNSSLSEGQ